MTTRPDGFWRRAARSPSFVIGGVLTALLAAVAFVSLFWSPHPPGEIAIAKKLAGPGAEHWLGTDSLGRDIASQLMVGAQNSIVVGVVAYDLKSFHLPSCRNNRWTSYQSAIFTTKLQTIFIICRPITFISTLKLIHSHAAHKSDLFCPALDCRVLCTFSLFVECLAQYTCFCNYHIPFHHHLE